MSSNSKILFIISQASNVNLPIIYKYDFDNQSLTLKFQTIGSFSGYGHGSIMLNDSQLFMLIFDSTTSGNLYFNKITFGNTVTDWTSKLTWSVTSWAIGISETLLSSDKTKLYIFSALGNPKYLNFMLVNLVDGTKADTWYRSDTTITRVCGSAQYGNYIVISTQEATLYFLVMIDLSQLSFSFKQFSGNSLSEVTIETSTGR